MHALGAFRLVSGVESKHDLDSLLPRRAGGVSVQEPQIFWRTQAIVLGDLRRTRRLVPDRKLRHYRDHEPPAWDTDVLTLIKVERDVDIGSSASPPFGRRASPASIVTSLCKENTCSEI
jgi:hypothetical protein